MGSVAWIIKQLSGFQGQGAIGRVIRCHPLVSSSGLSGTIRMDVRVISGGSGSGHLERTKDKPRDPDIHDVTVSAVSNLSPTVKKIVLSTNMADGIGNTKMVPFGFKAGQWVDLFVPGISKIGGFTITSSPEQLVEIGSLTLAIQFSEVEPAFWVHSKCQVGDTVSIRIGGDFYFDASDDRGTNGLLLIAGGVGINPLASIINHVHHGHGVSKNLAVAHQQIPTVLLYSAKSQTELLFKGEFDGLAKETKTLGCKYFLTREQYDGHDRNVLNGRIGLEDIQMAIKELLANSGVTLTGIKVYICGPPPMIQVMEEMTKHMKITNIAYEKWW